MRSRPTDARRAVSARDAAAAVTAPTPSPRANPELLGHEGGEQALLAAARGGRLAHAWLITGPAGIGKATLAFRFARYILARESPGRQGSLLSAQSGEQAAPGDLPGSAAGLFVAPDHPAFRRVASGGHADLLTVERGFDERRDRLRREIVVDDVRSIGAFLGQTPAEGGWRIVVVDSADALNRNAANALLKVLEEPPDKALLLLISDTPGSLLPTIRSRCRRLALQPLAMDIVTTLLARYQPQLEEAERTAVAEIADGSIGRALALAGAGAAHLHRDIGRVFLSLPALDVAALHRLCDDVLKQKDEGFAVLAGLIRWWLAGLARHAAAGSAGRTGAEEAGARAGLDALAGAAPLDCWLQVWEKTERLLAVVDSANLDRKQVLLSIFLDIAATMRR
ncbi:MAG: DNA polymerase III subunit delta' [Rhodospirillales bacterium]|nr:DNA polymerase III subunit delta' [Rhodospirillales bacterium]